MPSSLLYFEGHALIYAPPIGNANIRPARLLYTVSEPSLSNLGTMADFDKSDRTLQPATELMSHLVCRVVNQSLLPIALGRRRDALKHEMNGSTMSGLQSLLLFS